MRNTGTREKAEYEYIGGKDGMERAEYEKSAAYLGSAEYESAEHIRRVQNMRNAVGKGRSRKPPL